MPVAGSILITGGAGFVGSYTARRMVEAGYQVTCLLRKTTDAWRLDGILDRVEIARADLSDRNAIEKILDKVTPKVVVHLAWGGVLGSARNDASQVDNIASSFALMRAAIAVQCPHFVGLGSQAEYGPCADPIREDFMARPTTLYGISKLATYMVLDRLARETGTRFAWLRLFSSYGPKDDPNWLLPSLILRLKKRESLDLTKGEQLWDYIHVTDAAAAIERVVETQACGLFNLASGESRPLRSIVEAVRDLVDPSWELEFGRRPYRPDQVMRLEGDISALKRATGWAPVVSLEQGLKETVHYYLNL